MSPRLLTRRDAAARTFSAADDGVMYAAKMWRGVIERLSASAGRSTRTLPSAPCRAWSALEIVCVPRSRLTTSPGRSVWRQVSLQNHRRCVRRRRVALEMEYSIAREEQLQRRERSRRSRARRRRRGASWSEAISRRSSLERSCEPPRRSTPSARDSTTPSPRAWRTRAPWRRCVATAASSSRGRVALPNAGVDIGDLRRDLALLHRPFVIAKTNSDVQPAAHGTNGSSDEELSFVQQGTPSLLAAADCLRARPHADVSHLSRDFAAGIIKEPGVVDPSAYDETHRTTTATSEATATTTRAR